MVTEAVSDASVPKPIHILGMIVHNQNLTEALEAEGVVTVDGAGKTRLELLDEITSGTVIFTAHGISPLVYQKAKEKGLHCIDASCKDVIKTHNVIASYIDQGFDVIYIGKKGHPETEGCLGINEHKIHVVSHQEEIDRLNLDNTDIVITNQTTLSSWDVGELAKVIGAKYPTATFIKEICNATLIRQEAVAKLAKAADLTVVVGDPKSNNTKRLVQISEEIAMTPGIRIGDLSELDLGWLSGVETVAVTSGASTPTLITKEVIDFLERYDPLDASTHDTTSKINPNKILMRRR